MQLLGRFHKNCWKIPSISRSTDQLMHHGRKFSHVPRIFQTSFMAEKESAAFEIFRIYTTSISGLPKCRVSTELIDAHHEQINRRATNQLSSIRDVRTLWHEDLARDTHFFYFKRGKTTANCIPDFVLHADCYIATFSTNSKHVGMPITPAYEDIRLASK